MIDLVATWQRRDFDGPYYAFAAHVEEGLVLGEQLHRGEMEINGPDQALEDVKEEARDAAAYAHYVALSAVGPMVRERAEGMIKQAASLWLVAADLQHMLRLRSTGEEVMS